VISLKSGKTVDKWIKTGGDVIDLANVDQALANFKAE
jgi:hypothetical protein